MNLTGTSRRVRGAVLAALVVLASTILGGTCTTSDYISSDYSNDSGFDILDIPSG